MAKNNKLAHLSKEFQFDIEVNPATTYAGIQALPYVTGAVKAMDTINYVRQIDGLNAKAVISSLTTTDPIVASDCDFADAGNTTTLGERVLTLSDLKVNRQICRKTIFPTWVGQGMNRNGNLPQDFSDFLLTVVAEKAAAQLENLVWVGDAGAVFGVGFLSNDGVFDQAGLDASACADFTQIQINAGAATTNANIDDALASVFDSVVGTHPGLMDKAGFGFYMNNKMYGFYAQYLAGTGAGQGINALATNQDMQGFTYLGYPVYRCPGMPDDAIVATYIDNMVYGSNLFTDQTEASLIPTYLYDGSDNVRVVMNFSVGVQTGIGTDGVVGCRL